MINHFQIMNFLGLARLVCLCLFIVICVHTLPASAYEIDCGVDEHLTFLQTTILDVQRNAYDGIIVVSTANGKHFTQSGMTFLAKDGSMKISLLGKVSIESELLKKVGSKVTLLMSTDVDSLIVGFLTESGQGYVDGIHISK